MVGFRFSGRLALGPAVRLADRRHPLRLDVLTMTRSAYLQVRCAAVVQVGRAVLTLHPLFRGLGAKLDSISPTSSAQDFQLYSLARGSRARHTHPQPGVTTPVPVALDTSAAATSAAATPLRVSSGEDTPGLKRA